MLVKCSLHWNAAIRPLGHHVCRMETAVEGPRLLPVMLEHPWLPTDISTRASAIHPVRMHTYMR